MMTGEDRDRLKQSLRQLKHEIHEVEINVDVLRNEVPDIRNDSFMIECRDALHKAKMALIVMEDTT